MSVNDKWHYCYNSEVLVGSRAMRDRHLRLLGYIILQVRARVQNRTTSHCQVLVWVSAGAQSVCLLLVPPQLPYHELEKLNGIEEVKQYLHQKLLEVPL